jgi:hypothetical protein
MELRDAPGEQAWCDHNPQRLHGAGMGERDCRRPGELQLRGAEDKFRFDS